MVVTSCVPLAQQRQFCKAQLKELEEGAGSKTDGKTTSMAGPVLALLSSCKGQLKTDQSEEEYCQSCQWCPNNWQGQGTVREIIIQASPCENVSLGICGQRRP